MYNVTIFDIETLKSMYLLGVFVPGKGYRDFEISKYRNQIDEMIDYMDRYRDFYWVGYNNLRFDSQVVEFIYRNWHNWHDLSGLEICALIYQKAQDVIHDANFDVFPEYREDELSFKQIDLFKIHHYDNKNRMVSLKRLEFEMDFPNIEEMPINHTVEDITPQEIVVTKSYCKNDVKATKEFYYITIGETEHPLYKEDNKIEMRFAIQEEFGIPCLNFSNARIGDEIIKKAYCETTGILHKDLPRRGFFRKEIKLKYCIPSYIQFKTPQLRKFLMDAKKLSLKMDQDFVREIDFMGQTYTFAKGGLHNVIKGAIYEATETEDIIDLDVGGYYPAIIINNDYFPYHLGKAFLVGYSKVYYKRIELKPLAKKDKKIKGIVNGLKEAGNCPYGKSSDMDSWLFDKQMTLSTCITGEMSLLMLIESMELEGIKCIMANTDGASFIVPKTKREVYEKVKADWLLKTTRKLTYVLEEVQFKKMIFSSCNDYIGIKQDGEVKYKGDFLIDFELHKNKSQRIVNIALDKYYTQGIPVEETIKNHTNLYDFCIRQKATRHFHYEGVTRSSYVPTEKEIQEVIKSKWRQKSWWDNETYWLSDEMTQTDHFGGMTASAMRQAVINEIQKKHSKVNVYDKLIRYYISNKGEKLLKIKNPECTTRAAAVSRIAGEWNCTVCNFISKSTVTPKTDINYDYYIEQANTIIYKILSKGKNRKVKIVPNQVKMFG